MTLSIDNMYAYLATDEDGEGIAAIQTPMGWMPLIGADEARITSLRPRAEELANASGRKIALVKFSGREDLEVILPDPTNVPDNVVIFDPEKKP